MWAIFGQALRFAGVASLGYFINDVSEAWRRLWKKGEPTPPVVPVVKEQLKGWQKYAIIAGSLVVASVIFALVFPAVTKKR